jgi:serine/threonine-protein kinase
MLPESTQRAAALAVSRYGADCARVRRILQAAAVALGQGQDVDVLDLFVFQKLLTQEQADEVRRTVANPAVLPLTQIPGLELREDRAEPELTHLGSYRILRRLGEGAMSTVYLAYHEGQDLQVAVKVLADHLVTNQDYVDRFYREAKSAAALNHPNIVRGITAGQDRITGKHYLVLEYVDGPSVQALLEKHGRLDVGDAVHIALDVARALEHAHSRNFVHRDIKPNNILLTRSGLAKLADLGLSKRLDEASHLTAMRQGFGTPHYMPYEQALNAKHADGRSDIYALGATLYHLVTGELPFPGNSPLEIVDRKREGDFLPASTVNPAVPAVLDRILSRMMARHARDRYQMASDLIIDLERSQLAPPVLSFVDLELALQDPHLLARLTAPNLPTVPDLRLHGNGAKDGPSPPDLWYLRYRDAQGRWCKTRAATAQVIARLRDGEIPVETEVCREPQGDYQPLSAFPEFRSALPS